MYAYINLESRILQDKQIGIKGETNNRMGVIYGLGTKQMEVVTVMQFRITIYKLNFSLTAIISWYLY